MNGRRGPQAARVGQSFTALAHDLVSLAELQVQLMYVDAKDAAARSLASIIVLTGFAALALGSIPIVLIAAAEGLHEGAGWARWMSYLTVGVAGLVISAIAAYVCAQKLRAVTEIFERSRRELQQNIDFLKTLLRGSRPSAPTNPAARSALSN